MRAYNKYHEPYDLFKGRLVKRIFSGLSLMPMGATELALDRYLRREYKIDFKKACWLIFFNMTYHKISSDEVLITIDDDKVDKLRRIITYGVDGISGSSIFDRLIK